MVGALALTHGSMDGRACCTAQLWIRGRINAGGRGIAASLPCICCCAVGRLALPKPLLWGVSTASHGVRTHVVERARAVSRRHRASTPFDCTVGSGGDPLSPALLAYYPIRRACAPLPLSHGSMPTAVMLRHGDLSAAHALEPLVSCPRRMRTAPATHAARPAPTRGRADPARLLPACHSTALEPTVPQPCAQHAGAAGWARQPKVFGIFSDHARMRAFCVPPHTAIWGLWDSDGPALLILR